MTTQNNDVEFIRVKDIARIGGIGQSTVWAWVKSGLLPQPHAKLSKKCTVWKKSEILNAFESKAEVRS